MKNSNQDQALLDGALWLNFQVQTRGSRRANAGEGGPTNISPWVRLNAVLFLAVHLGDDSVVLRRQGRFACRDAPCFDTDENGESNGNRQDEEADTQEGEAAHCGCGGIREGGANPQGP